MKKIQYNGSSKILNGIVTKVNLIIDKLVVDVKVNGTSVVVVNEDGEREADIDLSLADQNVKQSPTTSSDNSDYRVLLSKSANDTEETDISRKDTNLKYNPSTENLQTTKLNGNTVPSGSGNDTLAKTSDIPDLSNYVQKSLTVGLIKNDGTIDQTQYATMSDIPTKTSDLTNDSNFVSDANYVHTDVNFTSAYETKLNGIASGAEVNVQSDWNQTDNTKDDFIKNKPINPVLWSEYNVLGAKNLIPYPWNHANGRVNRGITFGCNGEGYVSFDGTASTTQEPFFSFTGTSANDLLIGTFLKISGNKRYRMAIDRTDDRLWGIAYVRNLDGTDTSNLNIYVEFEDGSTATKSSNVNLRDSGINHTSLYFTIPTNDEYLLQVDVRCSANTGSYSASTAKAKLLFQYYEIPDLTWMPYAKSNYELTTQKFDWSAQNLVGSKNVLPYPYTEIYDSGLTVVYNKDGSVKVSCASQSATKLIRLQNRGQNTKLWLDSTRRYKMSCVTDKKSTASKSCGISLLYYNGSTSVQSVSAYANVSDMVILPSATANLIECYLFVPANTVIDNETFYPMVRNAEVIDNTWMPYADTNRNLSMNKADVSQIATVEWTNTASKAYDVGDYMVWRNKLYIVRVAISSGGAITVNTNVQATDLGSEVKKSKMWSNENIATIPNSSSSSKVYVTTSAYATEIYVQRMNIRSTSLGINETGYCSVTIPILPSMTNNYFVFMFRGDVDNKLYDGRLLFKKDSNGVYGYVSKVYQDGVLKSANDIEADIVVFEKS